MAQMYPPELPIAVLADPARRAEAALYKLLAQKLDDGFHVFFRPRVRGAAHEPAKIADFIILHNQHGLLGLAIADDGMPFAGNEPRPLPFAPIRSAVRSLIFALKEQGIRFYIPAPCGVVFGQSHPHYYEASSPDMDYQPIFATEFSQLQERIAALMPIATGYQSTWRVPNAIERIKPLLEVNTPLLVKPEADAPERRDPPPAAIPRPDASVATQPIQPLTQPIQPPRIVYMVRAIDIVLAIATILAMIMLIVFLPETAWHRIIDYSRLLAQSQSIK